jgi:FlaA1/EpsC-like NDP-sugar epimerase
VSPGTSAPAELLLGRPEFAGDLDLAARALSDQRVLITGAAGSVGTPLAHAVARAQPERLILLDHHEYSLFGLERELAASGGACVFELLDVKETARLERTIARHRPDVIFHLAAAKHVPYGERFAEGAVATNVLALASLLDIASVYDVARLVYPSSDKSVDPPSLYGATKRIGEALVQASAGRRSWSIVRYVNIIGTRGSVVEIFARQIEAGRPLSVTDDRMTRYWISMAEALWCLVQAAGCAAPGMLLMPDCGQAVPIIETARRLAGWYRPEQPEYPIACTGIRPGERLHEVLLSTNEWLEPGPANGLHVVRSRREPLRLANVYRLVEQLRQLTSAGDAEELKRLCLAEAEALQ